MEDIIKRYTSPTKLDHHIFGKIWISLKDHKESVIYTQVSHDPHKPHWISFGKFLEVAFHHYFDNNDFMDLAMSLYVNNQHDTLEKLKRVINKHD
jgi:hypothetical protein